jgi:hypothetical protein
MTKFQQLKDQLQSLEREKSFSKVTPSPQDSTFLRLGAASPVWLNVLLFAAFLLAFFLYTGNQLIDNNAGSDRVVETVQGWTDEKNEELLAGMGGWMEEMGYSNLSQQDLMELRQQGVTAPFISRMHDLGYSISAEELVALRQHKVTAYYTSNLHDLGYTDITQNELIRLKDTGVTISEVEQLIRENNSSPTVNELIRHHISNQ